MVVELVGLLQSRAVEQACVRRLVEVDLINLVFAEVRQPVDVVIHDELYSLCQIFDILTRFRTVLAPTLRRRICYELAGKHATRRSQSRS